MKVQTINSLSIETIARNDAEISNPLDGELVFRSQMTKETNSAYMKHVSQLVADIEKQGTKLGQRADMGELQKYREMITRLINETVSNGFAFCKESKFGVNGRSKIFAMIKTVNGKLDGMTKKLLEQEKENISFLDDIDDIRGLLVDMFL